MGIVKAILLFCDSIEKLERKGSDPVGWWLLQSNDWSQNEMPPTGPLASDRNNVFDQAPDGVSGTLDFLGLERGKGGFTHLEGWTVRNCEREANSILPGL